MLAVELDSTWQQVPPDGTGSGASGVDFLEPAGIYRDVTLRAVPQIFINDHHVGGCDELYALDKAGSLDPMLSAAP